MKTRYLPAIYLSGLLAKAADELFFFVIKRTPIDGSQHRGNALSRLLFRAGYRAADVRFRWLRKARVGNDDLFGTIGEPSGS